MDLVHAEMAKSVTESVQRQENVAVNGGGVALQLLIAMIRLQHLLLLTQMQEDVVLVMALLAMELVQVRMNAAVLGVIAGLAINIAQLRLILIRMKVVRENVVVEVLVKENASMMETAAVNLA